MGKKTRVRSGVKLCSIGFQSLLLLLACEPQNVERLQEGKACNSDFDCAVLLVCLDGLCHRAQGDAGDQIDASFDDAENQNNDAGLGSDSGTDATRPDSADSDGVDASVCVAATCESLAYVCGAWDDGCQSSINCGTCNSGYACGAQGQCECVPQTCEDLGVVCDSVSNGCGSTLNCGSCGAGSECQNNQCVAVAAVDCSGISANSGFELCAQTTTLCAGVFKLSQGCNAFCAAAGLSCKARYGGEPGCQKEAQNVLNCDDDNDHVSDWCECGSGELPVDPVDPVDPSCTPSSSNPPRQMEIHFERATYQPRSSWVLQCRDYAYTARYAEHEACDSLYNDGSGRGTASFYFDAPRGTYKVYLLGRHTENRNSAGALVRVRSDGHEWTNTVDQTTGTTVIADLVGTYCLGGSVEVMLDSTVNSQSDSVYSVRLVPSS